MRRIADVKEISIRLTDPEYLQRRARITRIDVLHIGILFKNLIELLTANIFHLACQRNAPLARDGGETDLVLFHQLRIEFLTLCIKKVHAIFIIQHHVNAAGHRMSNPVNGCHYCGMDVLNQYF